MDIKIVNILSLIIIVITACFLLLFLPLDFGGHGKLKGINKFIRFTKSNTIYNKIAYVVYPFIATYILFYFAFYNREQNELFAALYSIPKVMKAFVFEFDVDAIKVLFEENILYRIAWCINYPCALLFVYSTIINAFTDSLKNASQVKAKLKKSCDIVLGINEVEVYKENNENIIVWVQPNIKKEEEEKLKAFRIPYIKKEFSLENLNKLKFKLNGKNEYHFVSFLDENINLRYISIFEKYILQTKNNEPLYKAKTFYLHVEISVENIDSIRDKITSDHKELSPFVDLFNRHKLLAMKFIEENPITKYMPNFIDKDKGAIINTKKPDEKGNNQYDVNVNVLYLGFGRVSREIFRTSIMNDQIPSYNPETKEVKNHIINYYAFDKTFASNSNKNDVFYRNRYSYNEKSYDCEEYFGKPEKICNFKKIERDLNHENIYDDLISIVTKNKNSYTSIIVSLQEDVYNIDYALKLLDLFKGLNIKNYHIFVRVLRWNEEILHLLKDENVSFFGWKESVLNREVIVNKQLIEISKLTNKKYANKRLIDTNWYDLSSIKQQSNLYSSLNLRLKLNLLGYDYELAKEGEKVDNSILLKELEDKIKFEHKTYEDYLFFKNKKEPHVSQILAFQEHSRWNAFYITKGYVPYKISDIKLIDAETATFEKDDNKTKRHACLTTYQCLDKYHRYSAELLTKANGKPFEENLDTVETYKYDFNLMDSFNGIFKDKYILKRIEK